MGQRPLRSPRKGRNKRSARGLFCLFLFFLTAQANAFHVISAHVMSVRTNYMVTARCKRVGQCSFLDPRRRRKELWRFSAPTTLLVSTLLYFSSHVTTHSPVPKRVLTLLQLQHLTQSPGCPSGLGFCDLRDQLPATSLDDF